MAHIVIFTKAGVFVTAGAKALNYFLRRFDYLIKQLVKLFPKEKPDVATIRAIILAIQMNAYNKGREAAKEYLEKHPQVQIHFVYIFNKFYYYFYTYFYKHFYYYFTHK